MNLSMELEIHIHPQGQNLESPTQVYEEFFSQADIEFFKSRFELGAKKKTNTILRLDPTQTRKSNMMVNLSGKLKNEVQDCLSARLQDILPHPFELAFSFHKNHTPYGLHADTGYDEEAVLYKQGIIPLDLYPRNENVYTVIMNERCYSSEKFARDSIVPARKGLFEPITDAELEKYWTLSDERREEYSCYSIDSAFKWNPGDMLVWDRSLIHSSNDFQNHGVEWKLGLMWVTTLRVEI